MKKFYTLLVILTLFSNYIYSARASAAAQWMPDANLRTAVRSALNLANKDALTQAGMANLTGLTARNAQISSLTGLEHATNLTSLDLRDNTISNISALSGLTDLESLKLKGNNISSVSALSGLTNLTLLNLKENNISSISGLSGLTNLEHLRVDGNSITDVQPLTGLTSLKKLWIAGNSLTNAHLLSSLTGLTQIDIPIPDPPDTTAPSVTVSVPSGTQNGVFSVTITFTETVSGFTQSDISLTGSAASITRWRAGSNSTVYTATITPTASGTVTIGVAANVATDAANNQNTAATSKTVTVSVDTTAPGVSISVSSGVQTDAFSVTITFTEAVSGFTQSDLSLSGTASASITSWDTRDDTTYTATVTPTTSGTVTFNVRAGVATDAANNSNTAAPSKTVTVSVDTTAPGVSISVPSGVQTDAFSVTVTFTESVSGFGRSDLSLSGTASASITSWDTRDDTTYTATVTPTSSGTVRFNIRAGVATDAANNSNTAAPSKTVTVSVDTTAPGVSISVPSGVQNGAFNTTITFTEAVSGFGQSDVSLTGSAASITRWRANSNNTVYTATITPTASGTVTIGVAANVATDAANNQNTAATSKTVTVSVDTTAPGVSISVPSGVQTDAFSVTITFTESISGFGRSDLSLSGTASASITSWDTRNDTTYTATVTPTTSGTVTFNIRAGVATDAANNSNTAATSKTVTVSVDTTSPGVNISVPSGVQNGAFNAIITFTEAVSGFVGSEVSLTGSAASITGWRANSDNTVYTATITPTASGTVTVSIAANVATDAANNPNTAASPKTVIVDVDRPSVTIGVPSGTQTGAFDVTITFSETVSGFAQSDVSLSGSAASITGWRANSGNTVYTATITPTASGTVTIGVAANVATDAANNSNTAATSKTVTVNIPAPIPDPATWMPDANLRTAVRSALNLNNNDTLTQAGMANLTRLTARNAQISNLTGLEHATNLTQLDLRDNTISNISALSGLTNLESLKLKGNNVSSVSALSGLMNLTLLNLKENNISSISGLSGLTNLEHLRVDQNSITDVQPLTSLVNLERLWIAGNSLTNAHLLSSLTGLTYIDIPIPDPPDTTAPRVTVSAPSGVQNGAFSVTITFTETVSGFVGSDVSLRGSAASITSWRANSDNTVYTATVTPTASGTVTIGVAAGVATDGANNANTAATPKTVTVDADKPTVTIGVPSGTQTGAFDATITFSETVSGFVGSDVSLTGSTASITRWRANSNNTVYTATITPTASGTVTVSVDADVATDAAGNQNTVATSKTVTVRVDTEAPGVSISVPLGAQTGTDGTITRSTSSVSIKVPSDRLETGAFDVTITFTEPVSGFEQVDLSLTGTAAASITAWKTTDNTVYTTTITPTTSGTVTIDVDANVATDTAGNQNTAATSKTVTVRVDTEAPGVSISVPSGEQTGMFDVTITFSESVSGFTHSDVSVSGTANATISAARIAWTASNDGTTYSAKIKPTSGEVTLNVAQGVATDNANNPNTAATPQTVTVRAVDVTFTDTNLAAAVRAKLGLDASTPITSVKILDLLVLDATDSQISNLTGLEFATNLAVLALGQNNISNISPLVTVRAVDVTFTDTNLAAAVRAKLGLDASTPITSVKILDLLVLDATDSQISNLTGLEFATNLAVLALGQNNISNISPLAGLTQLGYLYLHDNQISDVTPLASLVELKLLWLKQNPLLPSPPIAIMNLMATLTELTYTDIEPLDPDALIPDPGLAKRVRAALGLAEDAKLTETAMLGLTSLSDAGHGWNIYSLTGLEHATNLTELRLNSYTISDISSLAELVSLTKLDLGANNLDDDDITHLAGLTNLTELTLYGNQISDISPLAGLTNLTKLHLFKCDISDLSPLSNLTNLTRLTLADNPISNLSPLSGLTQLIHLALHRCDISDINPLAGLVKLTSLSLEGNPILDTSPLFPLTQLERPLGEPSVWLDIDVSQYPPWDVNEDGSVDDTDSELVTAALGQSGTAIVNPRTDVNGDGTVDADDLTLVTDNLDTDNGAPSSMGLFTLLDRETLETLDPAILEAQLEILRAQSDGSLKYLRAIALLENLLAAIRPDETRLLANYPNPFNPETWIPYHLANDTDVGISIYDINGALVRQLDLGHQRAGYYTGRSRAAYWDGRNEFGERIATGIYFYQLQADNVSLLRKMVILK